MISIIVPNYNHNEFLPKRLETIFNQTFQDFEVILLDDCSSDGSWDYLKGFESHPKVSHCVRNQVNSGSPFKQWKKGMDLAKYEWIWIAESDDFSHNQFLNRLVDYCNDSNQVIFSKSNIVDESNLEIFESKGFYAIQNFLPKKHINVMTGVSFIINYLVFKNFILNASSVLFKKPPRFPEEILSMKFSGDWYFWIYLIRFNNIVYINKSLNNFRMHSQTTRAIQDLKNEEKRFKEIFTCISLAKSISKISFFRIFNNIYFDDVLSFYYRFLRKRGRLNINTIFPKMPFYLYFRYYLIMINSNFSN